MTISVHTTGWISVHGLSVTSPVLKYTTPSLGKKWISLTYFFSLALTFRVLLMPSGWTYRRCSRWTMTCSCSSLPNRSRHFLLYNVLNGNIGSFFRHYTPEAIIIWISAAEAKLRKLRNPEKNQVPGLCAIGYKMNNKLKKTFWTYSTSTSIFCPYLLD